MRLLKLAAMPENLFIQAELPPYQKKYADEVVFPTVLVPNPKSDHRDLKDLIRDQKPWLESVLYKTGAILFRGFTSSVSSASDFNDVVEAFGFEELPYVGGAAPRTNVVGRVFTSNESPPDQKIPFHHEMAQVPTFPSKVFFYCDVEAKIGGETPIVLSHVIYNKMKQKYPEFVDRLEEHGLIYTRVLGEDDDPSSPIGRGWVSTFLTKDKAIAAERYAIDLMKLRCIHCLKMLAATVDMVS